MSTVSGLSVNLTAMRRAHEGERPRFGSVWTWGTNLDYIRLMALSGEVPSDPDFDITVIFLDLVSGRIDNSWGWVTGVGAGWYCVDEGPEGAPRV